MGLGLGWRVSVYEHPKALCAVCVRKPRIVVFLSVSVAVCFASI